MFFFLGVAPKMDQYLHDANRRNQDAVLELRALHGWTGYGWLVALTEMMRETPGHRLTLSRVGVYAVSLGIDPDVLKQFVEDCLRIPVFEADGVFFWCPDLLQKMERYGVRAQKLSEAGRKGALARLAVFQARLKPGIPKSEARHTENGGIASDFSGLLNKTKQNSTEEVPLSLEVPTEVPAKPHPYTKYFNQEVQDLSGGRRPMLQYEHIWLHPWELEDARNRWNEAGMTLEEWRAGLRDASIDLGLIQHDRGYKGGKALKYLTGHTLTNALSQKKTRLDVLSRTGDRAKPAPSRKPSTGQMSPLGEVVNSLGIVKGAKS